MEQEQEPCVDIKVTPLKQKWSETKTRGFIQDYLSRPELWNTNSKSYTLKKEKQDAYDVLMEKYELNLNELKNKIRIYRTTYSQERKKTQTIANYVPKLSWYADMKNAFGEGKIKSFNKIKKEHIERDIIKKEDISMTDPLVQIEYDEEEYGNEDSMRGDEGTNHGHEVIVEPYEDDDHFNNDISYTPQKMSRQQTDYSTNSAMIASNSKPQTLLSSNELFLQSLKSSLDQLPDEKNMRARIKIQEILYQILYETP